MIYKALWSILQCVSPRIIENRKFSRGPGGLWPSAPDKLTEGETLTFVAAAMIPFRVGKLLSAVRWNGLRL